jgi:hypothetical protein
MLMQSGPSRDYVRKTLVASNQCHPDEGSETALKATFITRIFVIWCALFLSRTALALSGDNTIVSYLERYHELKDGDVNGRLVLADWCARNQLLDQQADLLVEVMKLRPDHASAYKDLLEADAKRTRAIDKPWAERLENLLGPAFRLHHSPHFTLLTDADDQWAAVQSAAVEETYKTFYQETSSIGLRPMPPHGRLVCIMFNRHDAYRDFLNRFEGVTTSWTAGFYSWRTNRAAFYNDHDNPAFKDIRDKIAELHGQLTGFQEEMDKLRNSQTAKRIVLQEQIKQITATLTDMSGRLATAAALATLGKTRHEATHQLCYNSGLQRRGR